MANTTNLNLVKPAGTDYALVSVINGNMDIIDGKMGAIPQNESVQSQINTLNNQIGTLTLITKSVPGNGSLNITVTNSCQAFIIAIGQSGARNAYILRQSGTSTPGILDMATSSNLSYSINDNVVTFTNSANSATPLHILLFNGSVS